MDTEQKGSRIDTDYTEKAQEKSRSFNCPRTCWPTEPLP